MGRPPKWSGPTRAIRVPEYCADYLVELARQLDLDSVQNSSPTVEVLSGPCLVSVNEKSYLVQPPAMLVGQDAEALQETMLLFDGLNQKELLLVLARLVEEWLEPVEVKRGR